MSEYVLSAVLQLKDRMTTKLKTAVRAVEGLTRASAGIGKATDGISKGAVSLKNVGINLNEGDLARFERLKGVMEAAGSKPIKPFNINANDAASAKIKKIQQELQNLVSKPWQAVVNLKNNASAALKNMKTGVSEMIGGAAMGMGATMLGTAGIGYGAVNAIQSQMDFEKQMSSVKAIYSGTYKDKELDSVMEQLNAAAEHAGATTKFTAKQAGEALYYMGMAGWSSEQASAGLMPVLNLASAGNTELGLTSDILTDSMTGFGLKAGTYIKNSQGKLVEASKHYADLMAALVTNANTDIPMLGETLKYAASNVGAMYADQTNEDRLLGAQDTMLIAGLMANAGIKSSQAGTSIRSFFAREGSENRNAYAAAQESLGVSFSDEKTGKVRRIKDIFSDLRQRFNEGMDVESLLDFEEYLSNTKIHKDTRRKLESMLKSMQEHGGEMSGADKLKMAAMINGQEGMSGLLAVLTASESDWEKINKALDEAEGTSERIAAMQLDNLAGDITILGSAWDAFQRSFVKGRASEGLREFTQAITNTLSKANKLFEDGIDIGDLGAIVVDVIAKLKAKFLELDGIGSVLAGGTLVFGLKKILSLGLKVKDTLSTWAKVRTAGDMGNILRGGAAATGSLQSTGSMNVSVGTMNVRAGAVNLTGAIKGGMAGGVGGAGGRAGATAIGGAGGRGGIGGTVIAGGAAAGAATKVLTATQIAQQKAERSALIARQSQARADSLIATAWARPAESGKVMAQYERASQRAVQAQARANQEAARYSQLRANDEKAASYYARRESVTLQQSYAADVATAQNETVAAKYARRHEIAGGAVGGAAMGAIFGAMDFAATRTSGQYNLEMAKDALASEKNQLRVLRENNADVEQINAQLEKIQQAENTVRQVSEANATAERRAGAGAAGMIAGTAIGAAVGSMVPLVGNMIGGMLGGFIGQKVGEYAADNISPVNGGSISAASRVASAIPAVDENGVSHTSMGDFKRDNDLSEGFLEQQRKALQEKESLSSENVIKNAAENISKRAHERRISLETDPVKRAELIEQDAAATEKKAAEDRHYQQKWRAINEKYASTGLDENGEFTRNKVEREKAFGYTSLGDLNKSNGWADSRGTGMQTTDEKSAVFRQQREDFQSGKARKISAIDDIIREGQERQKSFLDFFSFGENEDRLKNFGYTPLGVQTPTGAKTLPTGSLKQAESEIETENTPVSVAPEVAAANTKTWEERVEKSRTGIDREGTLIEQLRNFNAADFLESLVFGKAAASALHEETSETSRETFDDLKGYNAATEVTPEPHFSATSGVSEAAAATPTAPVNFGQPNFSKIELPEINIGEKISSGIESTSNALSSFKSSIAADFSEISNNISTALDSAKSAVTSGITEIGAGLSETFANARTSISEGVSNFATDLGAGFESVKTLASTTLSELGTTFSTGFESFMTAAATNVELLSTLFSTGFESLSTGAAATMESLSMTVSTGLETMSMAVSTILDGVSMTFSTSFEAILSAAAATFSSLTTTISANVEAAHASISAAFSGAAVEVQGIWSAIPGFFGGIFGSLGGIAAAAGSAIASGINSGIGMIQSAWEGLSGWLSSKIASLSAMASSAAASIGIGGNYMGTSNWHGGFTEVNEHGGELIVLPSGEKIYPRVTTASAFKDVAHNYTGTSYFDGGNSAILGEVAHNYSGTSFFQGGWSEVNGTGSELMYLPRGTKIINHATTVSILRRQIREKLAGTGYANNSILQQPQRQNTNTLVMANNVRSASTQSNSASDVRANSVYEKIGLPQDSLDNLTNVNIPVHNRITEKDSLTVKRAKQKAQRQSYFEQRQKILRDKSYLPSSQTSRVAEKSSTYKTDALGNIIGLGGLPDNVINAEDSIATQRAKREAQRQEYLSRSAFSSKTSKKLSKTGINATEITHNYSGTSFFGGGLSTVNEHGGEIVQLPTGATFYPQATAQNILQREIKTDRLGNIKNLAVPEYNRITGEDSLIVRRAKYQAQIRQLRSIQNENPVTALQRENEKTQRLALYESATNRQSTVSLSQPQGHAEIPRTAASQIESNARISARLNELRRNSRRTGISSLSPLAEKSAPANIGVEITPRESIQAQKSPVKSERSFVKNGTQISRQLQNTMASFNETAAPRYRLSESWTSRNSGIVPFSVSEGSVQPKISETPAQTSQSKSKNFIEKSAEAVNNFFYRLFHPRKVRAQNENRQYHDIQQQSLGQNSASYAWQNLSQNEVQLNRAVQRNALANIRGIDGRSFSTLNTDNKNAMVENKDTQPAKHKNFLQKGAESVNNFFYRLFHSRKYKAQRDIQQAQQTAQLRENQTNTITPVARAASMRTPRAAIIRRRVERDSQALSKITGKPAPQMGTSLQVLPPENTSLNPVSANLKSPLEQASNSTSLDSLTRLSNSTTFASSATANSRKSFLDKSAESVNNFFYRLFHPRKWKEQQEAKKRGYRTDALGNIIGLNGLPDNVIRSSDSITVQRAKREAQRRELLERQRQSKISENVFKQTASSATGVSDTSSFFATTKPADSGFNLWSIIENIVGGVRSINQNRSFSRGGNWLKNLLLASSVGSTIFGDSTSTPSSSFVSTQPKSNIRNDIINIWRQSKKKNSLLSYDKIWKPILNFGGASAGLSNFGGTPFVTDFGDLPTEQPGMPFNLGDLPAPSFGFEDMARQFTANNSSTSSSTTNNSSSSATNNFNFGDVNINNGADFDDFMNRLKNLFVQGAGNYAG